MAAAVHRRDRTTSGGLTIHHRQADRSPRGNAEQIGGRPTPTTQQPNVKINYGRHHAARWIRADM
jgi:hypothetical protein